MITEPNAFFAQFHGRQVCHVDPEQADAWMEAGEPDEVLDLLAPAQPRAARVPPGGQDARVGGQ